MRLPVSLVGRDIARYCAPLAGFDKVPVEGAGPAWRAFMVAGALGLGLVGENHFADCFATGDGGIKDGHGDLHLFEPRDATD